MTVATGCLAHPCWPMLDDCGWFQQHRTVVYSSMRDWRPSKLLHRINVASEVIRAFYVCLLAKTGWITCLGNTRASSALGQAFWLARSLKDTISKFTDTLRPSMCQRRVWWCALACLVVCGARTLAMNMTLWLHQGCRVHRVTSGFRNPNKSLSNLY
jgi:hypothetical protein